MPYSTVPLIFLLFIIILFAAPYEVLMDADTGWHIMAGHEILSTGHIPAHNIFSFTASDYRWLNLSWLWDAFAAIADSIGGLYLLAALTIISGGLVVALLMWFCVRRGYGTIASVVAVTLGIMLFLSALLVRPHEVTTLFTLVFTIILYFFDKNPQRKLTLIALPLMMLAWVNLHGGFLTGFTVIGAYFLQFMVQKRWVEAKQLCFIGLLTTAAIFVNPLGVDIFTAANRTLGGVLKYYVDEWKRPDMWKDYIYMGGFAFVFIATFRRHSIAEKILCIFWLAEGALAMRNLPILMVVSVPVFAAGISELSRGNKLYKQKEKSYSADFSKPFVLRSASAIAVFLAIFFASPVWPCLIGFTLEQSPNYPKAEIDYIIANRPNAVLFNHYSFGGYVIYESGGKLKTFIDGRAETAFPPELVADYLKFHLETPGWEKLIDKYRINTVLLPNDGAPELEYFSSLKHWHKVYTGDNAVVFFKN